VRLWGEMGVERAQEAAGDDETRGDTDRASRLHLWRTRDGDFSPGETIEEHRGWSEGAVEMVLWTGQTMHSYREAAEALEQLAGLTISKSRIYRMVKRYGEVLVQHCEATGAVLCESGVNGEAPPPLRDGQQEKVGVRRAEVMVWGMGGNDEERIVGGQRAGRRKRM